MTTQSFRMVLAEVKRRVAQIAENSCTFGKIRAEVSGGQVVSLVMSSTTHRMPELERLADRYDSGLSSPVELQIEALKPYITWVAAHLNPLLTDGSIEIGIAHGAMADLQVYCQPPGATTVLRRPKRPRNHPPAG